MLMREVDDAVRQDQFGDVARKYGVLIAAVLVVGLAAFGGWLFWQNSQETRLEEQSEVLVTAIDELEAGNFPVADRELAEFAQNAEPGAASTARLIRAGIAAQSRRNEEALALYEEVSADEGAPDPYRQFAAIRAVALNYDEMEPAAVIQRLGPLATAENPWFGSAGELVAMAYLEQGNEDEAGPLLVEIAKSETVPDTLRARARQLAGLLGYDAVEDVDAALAALRQDDASAAAGAPGPQ